MRQRGGEELPTGQSLWRRVDDLQEHARRLRGLSQLEPLLQARPDYPRFRIGRSHADEVREALEGISWAVAEIQRLLPHVLPRARRPPGTSAEDDPDVLARKVAALARIAGNLQEEAFEPPPQLPPHAPPYLAEAPLHDFVGSKAVLLAQEIDEVAGTLRNTVLSAFNQDQEPGEDSQVNL
jgi:hypothetical protein